MNLLAQRHLLEGDGHARRLLDIRVLATEEVRLNAAVLDTVKNRTRGGISVAASATGFLIVRLDTPWEVIMDDEADVALVDSEAERVGRDDGLEAVGHEPVLHVLAIRRRHLAVIDAEREVVTVLLVQPLGLANR